MRQAICHKKSSPKRSCEDFLTSRLSPADVLPIDVQEESKGAESDSDVEEVLRHRKVPKARTKAKYHAPARDCTPEETDYGHFDARIT